MMKGRKEGPLPHELRDRPVPPVKGVVTDQTDVVLRPDGLMGPAPMANLEDTIVFDGWM